MGNYKYLFGSFLLGALVCFLLLKQCSGPVILKGSHTETITRDTIWPDTVFKNLPVPYPVPGKSHSVAVYDTNACKFTRIYADSLVDSNLVIAYQDSVTGLLLGKKMSYRLKVPLRIETTKTITDSIPFLVPKPANGLYVSGGAGFDRLLLVNLNIGADFVSKNKWGAGYHYDILNKTHNVSIKQRILKF